MASNACLWDRDTLSAELRGLPDIAGAVAGRFDRYPDLYYQMRIDRISKQENWSLEDYDDWSVAQDRLGRSDEAIAGMARKEAAMSASNLPAADLKEHRYRWLANKATFLAHKALRTKPMQTSLLKQSAKLLQEALVVNPDAHFGRERVQLAMIDALLTAQEGDAVKIDNYALPVEGRKLTEGVIGLMALGNAWESYDAFAYLRASLEHDDGMIGQLVTLKLDSLMADGKGPVFTNQIKLPIPDLEPEDEKTGVVIFAALQVNGKKYRENLKQFLTSQLHFGKHPDTDKEFWTGYTNVSAVDISGIERHERGPLRSLPSSMQIPVVVFGVLGSYFLMVVLAILIVRKRQRNRSGSA